MSQASESFVEKGLREMQEAKRPLVVGAFVLTQCISGSCRRRRVDLKLSQNGRRA